MSAAEGAGLVALTVVLTGHLLLVTAGLHTVRRPAPLLVALLTHRLLPTRVVFRRSVRWYGAFILVVGACAGAAALGGATGPSGVAAAVVYGAFAVYLTLVRVLRGALPCGCWGGAGRADAGAVLRSLAFVVAGVVLTGLRPQPTAGDGVVVLGVAAAAVAVLVALPPSPTRPGGAVRPARPARTASGRRR